MKLTLPALERHRDLALLVTRVALGAMFVFVHGLPKLEAGAERWRAIGGAVGRVGIDFGHQWFGLAAALAEAGGGVLLIAGFMTRLATVPMLVVMALATAQGLAGAKGLLGASHPIETGLFLLLLLVVGPGRYSVDARLG